MSEVLLQSSKMHHLRGSIVGAPLKALREGIFYLIRIAVQMIAKRITECTFHRTCTKGLLDVQGAALALVIWQQNINFVVRRCHSPWQVHWQSGPNSCGSHPDETIRTCTRQVIVRKTTPQKYEAVPRKARI